MLVRPPSNRRRPISKDPPLPPNVCRCASPLARQGCTTQRAQIFQTSASQQRRRAARRRRRTPTTRIMTDLRAATDSPIVTLCACAVGHTRHANDPSPVVVSAPCLIGRHEHSPPGSRPTAQQRRRAATPQPSGSRTAAPPHGIRLSARPLRRAATPPSSISTAQHRRRHTTSPRAAPTPPRASVAAH